MKRRIAGLVVLILAGVAGWVWWTKHHGREDGELQFHGNVDIREVSLGFRVSGRIAGVDVQEGDSVKAGAILAGLDDEPYRRDVEVAQAQAAAARARVQWVEAGSRPQEVQQVRALVREREITAGNAERLYKRQTELLESKAVSIQDRDDAEARYREAEARLKSAREQLALLEAGFRAEEIAQAKADLHRAEAALASSQLRLEDTTLKAPSDGIVLTRAQEPGAIVQSGTTVLTVSLQTPVWVRAYVEEAQLGKIHPGQKVRVYTDTRTEKPYSGQIGYISPRAEFTPKNVETAELRTSLVYRFRVTVTEPDLGLRQGMPVTVRVGVQ